MESEVIKVRVLAFAQAKELLNFSEEVMECKKGDTPRNLVCKLRLNLESYLSTWRVAVDQEYVDWDQPLENGQELAIIPPVSGG